MTIAVTSQRPPAGIGRMVSENWLAEFSAIFEREMPPSVHLTVPHPPSMLYARGKDFETIHHRLYTPPQITALIGKLCTDRILDIDSAAKGQYTFFDGLQVDQRDTRALRLRVKVRDVTCASYACGYLLTGERTAIQKGLGIVRKYDQSFGPRGARPRVNLGYINGWSGTGVTKALAEIRRRVPQVIEFSPIDAV